MTAVPWLTDEHVDAITLLLLRLSDEGWSIGPPQVIATHNLLLALSARGDDVAPDEMARWIGPIVCRSRKQQTDFPAHLQHALQGITPPLPPPLPPAEHERRLLRTALLLVGVAVLIVGIWLLMPKSKSQQQSATPEPKPVRRAPTNDPTGQPVAVQTQTTVQQAPKSSNYTFPAIGILTLALLATAVRLTLRARGEHQLRKVFADDQSMADYFPAVGAIPVVDLQYRGVAQALRQRRFTASAELDVMATIERTANRGGVFAPAMALRGVTPDYVVFIDQATADDIQAKVFGTIAQRLAAFGVAVDAFYFDGDPRVCWRAGKADERFRFDTIAAAYAGYDLLLFTAGDHFRTARGQLQRWTEGFFSSFRETAMFTPKPVPQWGTHEWILARAAGMLLPASSNGIAAYVARRERKPLAQVTGRAPLVPVLLEDDEEMWLSPAEPERHLVRQLIEELRLALGDDAMRWLAATAVYPGIDWTVLLYLGVHLQIPSFEENLLALARLPWFRHGRMPDWLRIRLIWTLDEKEQQQVREVLFQMFANAVAEKSGQTVRLSYFRDLAHALGEGHELGEHVIVDFMSGRKVKPENLTIPQRFALAAERMIEERGRKQGRRLHRHWAKRMLAYVPLATLFLTRAAGDEMEWHKRMGGLWSTLLIPIVLLSGMVLVNSGELAASLALFLLLLIPWLPVTAVAALRAAYDERLRIPILAAIADRVPATETGTARAIVAVVGTGLLAGVVDAMMPDLSDPKLLALNATAVNLAGPLLLVLGSLAPRTWLHRTVLICLGLLSVCSLMLGFASISFWVSFDLFAMSIWASLLLAPSLMLLCKPGSSTRTILVAGGFVVGLVCTRFVTTQTIAVLIFGLSLVLVFVFRRVVDSADEPAEEQRGSTLSLLVATGIVLTAIFVFMTKIFPIDFFGDRRFRSGFDSTETALSVGMAIAAATIAFFSMRRRFVAFRFAVAGTLMAALTAFLAVNIDPGEAVLLVSFFLAMIAAMSGGLLAANGMPGRTRGIVIAAVTAVLWLAPRYTQGRIWNDSPLMVSFAMVGVGILAFFFARRSEAFQLRSRT